MPHNATYFQIRNILLRKRVDFLNTGDKLRKMKVLIDIDDNLGERLDALAKEQSRSRSAQARHMLQGLLLKEIQERLVAPSAPIARKGGEA